jgi:Taurine catabolism dioxygenase TauD, TfdA family
LLPDLPVSPSLAPADIMADLSRIGLALVDGVTDAAQLIELTRSLGATVVPHRDSGPDGVTAIEDRSARAAALAGFTRSPLSPHTDRSGTSCPPDLLLTACGQAATSGGEALLVDGRAVYLDLAQNEPDALRALARPRSALFGGAAGQLCSVFTIEGGVIAVRLRLDSLARFGPTAAPHIPALWAAIGRHARTVPMRTGFGYVLDNRRWLHGRRAYEGPRLVFRVIASARAGSIAGGFMEPDAGSSTNPDLLAASRQP